MGKPGYIYAAVVFLLAVSCGRHGAQPDVKAVIDGLNREAFDLRYKDMEAARAKSAGALELIEAQMPGYYDAKAQAWNSIAHSYFLTSYFDSTRMYLDKVRSIGQPYANKEIEEAMTYVTEARLLLRECRYA